MRIFGIIVLLGMVTGSSCNNVFDTSFKYSSEKITVNIDESFIPVLILGGGVAGLTAANYLAQATIPCTIIEGFKPGGALAQSDSVRNWPGELVAPGAFIVKKLKDQVLAAGVNVTPEEAIRVDYSSWPYTCVVRNKTTGEQRTLKTLAMVVAMGATPHYLNISGENGTDGYWGKGVTNCAVCDGSLYRGKKVLVVGGGDSAVAEAMYLAGIAKEVIIVVRSNKLRARDARKITELQQQKNVTIMYETQVTKIQGNGRNVTGVVLKIAKADSVKNLLIDGVFLAIGASPNTTLFNQQLKLDAQGYILVAQDNVTSVQGVFAAGDIIDPVYKQAVTSASDGCKAAFGVSAFLQACGYSAQLSVSTENLPVTVASPVEKNDFLLELSSSAAYKEFIIAHKGPVVIEVCSNFCISCQELEPAVTIAAQFFKNRVAFAKVNLSNKAIDAAKITESIGGEPLVQVPTLLFINAGNELDRTTEILSAEALRDKITSLFDRNEE